MDIEQIILRKGGLFHRLNLIVGAEVIVFYEITIETAVRISSARLQV